MRVLLLVLVAYCLSPAATDDNLAVESDYENVKRHHVDGKTGEYDYEGVGTVTKSHTRPLKKFRIRQRPEESHPKPELAHREREARDSWKPIRKPDQAEEESHPKFRGSTLELPLGYDVELPQQGRKIQKYYQEPKYSTLKYVPVQVNSNDNSNSGISKQNIVTYQNYPESNTHQSESNEDDQSYKTGSFLSHIKENMHDGKLLGYSSFVEHFSENDDDEELKTAMKEGSLDDLKKLVPKSGISFQMFHGPEEEREVKVVPVENEKKTEIHWNAINEWHQPTPTPWTRPQEEVKTQHLNTIPHKTVIFADRKKRMRKQPEKQERKRYKNHRYVGEGEETKHQTQIITPEPEPTKNANQVHEVEYPQIVPSISYELPSETYLPQLEGESSKSNFPNYVYEFENWSPVHETSSKFNHAEYYKQVTTPKPPESSQLYYEHVKSSKPGKKKVYSEPITYEYSQEDSDKFEEPDLIEAPKVGRIIVKQTKPKYPKYTQKYIEGELEDTPEPVYRLIKKPLKVQNYQTPTKKPLAVEEFQSYSHFPPSTASSIPARFSSPQPIKYQSVSHWSEPDIDSEVKIGKIIKSEKKVKHPVAKLEKIINKQVPVIHGQSDRPSQESNIFLTKEFQNDVSDHFSGIKSDFEWVPSTNIRYDTFAHASTPERYQARSTSSNEYFQKTTSKRSERNLAPTESKQAGTLFLEPENDREFSVSASYKIEKNRKNDSSEK